jgi:hypothetical protein
MMTKNFASQNNLNNEKNSGFVKTCDEHVLHEGFDHQFGSISISGTNSNPQECPKSLSFA